MRPEPKGTTETSQVNDLSTLLQFYRIYCSAIRTATAQASLPNCNYLHCLPCVFISWMSFPSFNIVFSFPSIFFKLYFIFGEKKIVRKRKQHRRGENKEVVLSFSHIYSILEIEK